MSLNPCKVQHFTLPSPGEQNKLEQMLTTIPNILVVEDNPDHIEMIRMALSGEGMFNNVYSVTNGEDAIDYLFRRGAYADKAASPRPSIILLDIKLPRMDGFEVLQQVKGNNELKPIPVILLTTSTENKEVIRGYAYGANSYVTKPLRFDEFMDRIKSVYIYWVFSNMLPVRENNGYFC